jgi:hypothetical protein
VKIFGLEIRRSADDHPTVEIPARVGPSAADIRRRRVQLRYWKARTYIRDRIALYRKRAGPVILDAAGLALFAVSAFRVPVVGSWLGFAVAGMACLAFQYRLRG